MSFLALLWLVVIGLAIGALGRLVIPGKNPMATWMTAVVGLVGGVGGGAITQLILGNGHSFIRLVMGVVCAALLVMAIASWQRTRGEGT
jgi:uncharacterized membrane protein YeaQ/YmgE (transglycosylase-associated protein family)